MTILAVIVAIALALLAFRFIVGMMKFAVLAAVVLLGLFVAYEAGAF